MCVIPQADSDHDGNVNHSEFSHMLRTLEQIHDATTHTPHFMNANDPWKRKHLVSTQETLDRRFHPDLPFSASSGKLAAHPKGAVHRGVRRHETHRALVEHGQELSHEDRVFEGSLRDSTVTKRERRAFSAHGHVASFRRMVYVA